MERSEPVCEELEEDITAKGYKSFDMNYVSKEISLTKSVFKQPNQTKLKIHREVYGARH